MTYTINDYVSAALEAMRTARTHLYHAGLASDGGRQLARTLNEYDRLDALIMDLSARQNAGEFDA